MSEQDREGNDRPEAAPAKQERAAAEGDTPSAAQRIAEDEEERPAINLQRYFTQRRPRTRASTMHIVTLVLMVAAVVMIFLFKDRCGLMVATMFDQVSGAASQPAERNQPGIPVTPPR